MQELILIRHGQSEQHIHNITGGWSDTALTDLGIRQAERTACRVGQMLPSRQIRLFTSDLQRAVKTAAAIGAAVGVPLEVHPGLRESNNGQAAGLTREAAKAIERPVTHPTLDWIPYPGAESWRMMTRRVFACLDEIANQVPDTAILVSHGNTGIAIVHWWLQLCENCRRISCEIEPCSITRLTVNSWGERTIAFLNDTSHL